MEKVNISAVSYLNSKPLIYGLQHSDIAQNINLELDIPSVCAEKLLQGRVDIGLIPVAVLPELQEYHILSDFCIGANGPVSSVMLYSQVPLEEISHVFLDFHSRTSVQLVQILANRFWKVRPLWKMAFPGYIDEIKGDVAGVVIGDRTFGLNEKFRYAYDLSEEWKKYTGLPFVFACWVANKKLPKGFLKEFNEAVAFGVRNLETCIREEELHYGSLTDVRKYLKNYISFPLDTSKLKGLELFLEELALSSVHTLTEAHQPFSYHLSERR